MKILAIRGKNLASLSSEFEVNFQNEPLASAGLFAITGPTGSGKSTLLDALCLALYEKTPRLIGVGRSGDIPDVGDNGITPGDVRTILRRGAAEGFAEVDFVGSDGIAYRSRWTVRRARSKADGKMQNSEVSLIRILDGQTLGDHRKTETLRLIETCIGLSFEQFTRAVLLAQNDFSTFLKATDDDRAELLQTLTGTENFSAISIQAFDRMKAEKEILLRLQVQLKDQEPLAPEIRVEKDAQFQTQSASAQVLTGQKLVLESQLRWYQQWEQLKVTEGEAAQNLEATTTEKQSALPRYQQLELVDRVQPSRPLWVEQRRVVEAVNAGIEAQRLAKVALTTSQDSVAAHLKGHCEALMQQTLAESAKVAAQPDIDSARALDASIVTITPQFEAAAHAHSRAAALLKTEQSRQVEAEQRMAGARTELETAQQWLAEHSQLQPLAEGWQRWEALFGQAQHMVEIQSKSTIQVSDLKKAVLTVEKSLADATASFDKATKAVVDHTAQLAVLIQECAAVDVEKLSGERIGLEETREQLQTASQLWEKRVESQKRQLKQTEQRGNLAGVLATSEADLQSSLQRQPLLESELQVSEEALNLATLAASENADTMRAALQPDKECPVCGSLEHPYSAHTPAMDDLLKSLKKQAKAKQKALRDLESSIAIARAAKASAELSLRQITLELAQLESETSQLNAEWATLALRAQIDLVPESDRTQWLKEQQETARRDIEQLTQQEALYRDTLKRKDVVQAKVNAANIALVLSKEALSGLDTKNKTTAQALETARSQESEIARQIHTLEGQLDGAFDDQHWRKQWSQNPSDFVLQCGANAKAWLARQKSVATLSGSIAALQVEISACEKACLQASAQLTAQTESRDAVELVLNTYRANRNKLFQGRLMAEVQAALNKAIEAAKSAFVASQTALNLAQAEEARSMEAARQTELLLQQHRTALGQAQTRLDDWLVEFNIESRGTGGDELVLEALDGLLQIAPEWSAGEREALQRLENTLTTAQAVLATRSQSRMAHETDKTVEQGPDLLQENLTRLTDAIAAANESLSTLKFEITKDDERLQLSQSMRINIEKQAAVSRVWSQLSDLIGSSDGKKFRNFAQQLTLDILLTYGNQHLQNLTRRYRLQRIKDSLGLLVVDQDMGDEVRSVHSLSGGESFLVSLALALGLASLSSHRVRVESLFIDEGFGSLDADSLGIAMDALDNLQSQGRKVGVISHVHEMTERIGTRVQVQRQAGGLSRIVVC